MKIQNSCIILIIFLCVVCFSFNNAYAGTNLSVSTTGAPVTSGKSIFQDLSIVSSVNGNFKIVVTPMTSFLINTSHPSSKIPINKLEIQNSDNLTYYSMEPNKPLEILSGNNISNLSRRIVLKLSNTDVYYPGIYTCNLQFTLISESGTSSSVLNVVFNQPEIQDIYITPSNININIVPENSNKASYKKESTFPTKIYIRSNKDWKLVLNALNFDNSLNYAFKVLALPDNYKVYYNSDYTALSISSYVIAEGGPTVLADLTTLDAKIIEVNYLLQTNVLNNLTAGSYPLNVRYELISN